MRVTVNSFNKLQDTATRRNTLSNMPQHTEAHCNAQHGNTHTNTHTHEHVPLVRAGLTLQITFQISKNPFLQNHTCDDKRFVIQQHDSRLVSTGAKYYPKFFPWWILVVLRRGGEFIYLVSV